MQELYKCRNTDIDKVKDIIKRELSDYELIEDEYGNLYGPHTESKNNACHSAHLDIVETNGRPDEFFIITAPTGERRLVANNSLAQATSLGADDKNGVCLIIKACQAVKTELKPRVAFFLDEEIGRVGSLHRDVDFIDECDFVIVVDRRGTNEIITNGSRGTYTSVLGPLFKFVNPDWVFAKGYSCDADSLKHHVDTINISAGYESAHTKDEYTLIDSMEAILNAIVSFLEEDLVAFMPWQEIKEMHNDLYTLEKPIKKEKKNENTYWGAKYYQGRTGDYNGYDYEEEEERFDYGKYATDKYYKGRDDEKRKKNDRKTDTISGLDKKPDTSFNYGRNVQYDYKLISKNRKLGYKNRNNIIKQ